MVLLESLAILAIRAMIRLYARSSSLGRNAAHDDVPLLWAAEAEEETRSRNSKGTTDPIIGRVLPRVEAINVGF